MNSIDEQQTMEQDDDDVSLPEILCPSRENKPLVDNHSAANSPKDENKKNVEIAREFNEHIRTDGFKFDAKGQLIPEKEPDEDKIVLDSKQQKFLDKISDQSDQSIPVRPPVDPIFDLAKCRLKLYNCCVGQSTFVFDANHKQLQINAKTKKISLTADCDYLRSMLRTAGSELAKAHLLDCIMVNFGYYAGSSEFIQYVQFLHGVLRSNEFQALEWHFTPLLACQILEMFGLQYSKLPSRLTKHLSSAIKLKKQEPRPPEMADSVLTVKECALSSDTFANCLQELLKLVVFSMQNTRTKLKDADVELMLILFSTVIVHTPHLKHQPIYFADLFETAFVTYNDNKARLSELKFAMFDAAGLCTRLLTKPGLELCTNYHRFLHLISLLQRSASRKLQAFIARLAFVAVKHVLLSFSLAESQLEVDFRAQMKVESMIALLKSSTRGLMETSGYAMHLLLHLLNIFVTRYDFNESNISHLVSIQQTMAETNRRVRDKMELRGRGQAKLTITHFLYKCEFLLKKHGYGANNQVEMSLGGPINEGMSGVNSIVNLVDNEFSYIDDDKENIRINDVSMNTQLANID